jgi:hypothetical protein
VVQEDIEGVVTAAYTHYDSRASDPQLHDHVVVWNRARSVSDVQWRSRSLFRSVVTMSEIYDRILSDLLTAELGVGWETGASRNGMPKHDITGAPDALIRGSRSPVGRLTPSKMHSSSSSRLRREGRRGR